MEALSSKLSNVAWTQGGVHTGENLLTEQLRARLTGKAPAGWTGTQRPGEPPTSINTLCVQARTHLSSHPDRHLRTVPGCCSGCSWSLLFQPSGLENTPHSRGEATMGACSQRPSIPQSHQEMGSGPWAHLRGCGGSCPASPRIADGSHKDTGFAFSKSLWVPLWVCAWPLVGRLQEALDTWLSQLSSPTLDSTGPPGPPGHTRVPSWGTHCSLWGIDSEPWRAGHWESPMMGCYGGGVLC